MKNKYMTFVALAVAALATSCTSDDLAGQNQIQNQSSSQTVTLTASVDNEQTRVGMTKDGNTAKFYWHNGDAISVLTVNGTSYENTKFTTTAENGAITATFTGDVTGKVGGYALYPYSENHKFDGTAALTYNLPASYKYEKVESKIFGTDADYLANSTNMPMLGTIASGNITFKHLGGLAVIRIDKMPAASGTLTVTADQQLSGNFTVGDLTGTPNIATTSTNVTNADKKVTFTFSNATANGVGVFYLPLATGDYTSLTITIAYGTGTDNATTHTIPYGSLTVARKDITAISLTTDSKGNLRHCVKNDDGSYTINGHKFIDLGLSSGLLWAETNVGATNYYDYGTYYSKDNAFAWSEWGTTCRLPTKAEFETLNSCGWAWSTESGINGYKVTSNVAGYTDQSIFFPAASYKNDSKVGSFGYYWSSPVGQGRWYYSLSFWNGSHSTMSELNTGNQYPIRAVAEKPATTTE